MPPNDTLLPLQWYIDKAATPLATVDLNVRGAWQDYSGAGVSIGIFDERVDTLHPDLATNYDVSLEIAGLFNGTGQDHGTAVAGIIAGASNGQGITGIAYGAKITSAAVLDNDFLRLTDFATALAAAARFDVVNMSLGDGLPFSSNVPRSTWEPLSDLYAAASATGRDGLGTILVEAAGNSRGLFTSTNLSWLTTQREAIVVGAVQYDGTVSRYSTPGATVFVAAPSSGNFSEFDVATTDLRGADGYNTGLIPGADLSDLDYTQHFGGTSAATPMVSAVVALMLEANPDLGWRDVRDILAITARQTGAETGWTTNAAGNLNGGGYHFSHDAGFGLIDATAAVRLAESWGQQQTSANEVSQEAVHTTPFVIPKNTSGRDISFTVAPGAVVENILLDVNMTFGVAALITIVLTSPSGTKSVLFNREGFPEGPSGGATVFRPWEFGSNAFRGEDAGGEWKVTFTYASQFGEATVQSLKLSIFGDAETDDDSYFYTNEYGAFPNLPHDAFIADAAGIDTLNAAAVTGTCQINLNGGSESLINGQALTIRPGSVIEHAITGDGDDIVTGNGAANHLRGARGRDLLLGRDGADILEGGQGNDRLLGGAGDDRIDGGAGVDVANYAGATSGVRVSLSTTTAQNTVGAGIDTLTDIENLFGSAHADRLTGNAQANLLNGAGGADNLRGGSGDDFFGFSATSHSSGLSPGLADTIFDFHALASPGLQHDRINLRVIDAIEGGADDAFVFIGDAAFSGLGQLRCYVDGTNTIVEGNTAGDNTTAELRIILAGNQLSALLSGVDFIL